MHVAPLQPFQRGGRGRRRQRLRGSLDGWWQDDDFDADRPAFYYARVLEIPTPRWST
ncbi:MAG: DUF3604 domain-containing protein, partial [Flavobacteriales bacterium]